MRIPRLPAPRLTYSRAETRADALVHVTGLGAALLAVPLLLGAALVKAIDGGSVEIFAAFLIYGLAFLAMIGASALFNLLAHARRAALFRRLDHSAIYLKIAGTYTPFTLIPGQGLWLVAGLWGAALTGVVLKLISPDKFRALGLILYLGMGWVGVALLPQMLATLPGASVVLIVAGGLLYTLGVVFYLWSRLPYHYVIWHLFVLVASFTFYAAAWVLVLSPALTA
ncbi:MAG: PAQR family membrane homeostasis protein TrhA [Roseinatronobacter sp.]